MIATNNYFKEIEKIDFTELPEVFRKGHEFLENATDRGNDWTSYQSSDSIKKTIDLYLQKLNSFLKQSVSNKQNKKQDKAIVKKESPGRKKTSRKLKVAKDNSYLPIPEGIDASKLAINYFRDVTKMETKELKSDAEEINFKEENEGLNDEEKQYKTEVIREINRRLPKSDPNKLYSQDIPPETDYEKWRIEFRNLKKMIPDELEEEFQKVLDVENYNGLTEDEKKYKSEILALINKKKEPTLVERIPDELRFIRRFVNLNGKTKTKDDLLRFINSLQKAIVEKRIRKTSSYAERISFIQKKLIDTYNSMKAKIAIELKRETYDTLKKLIGEEKVLASIGFIKRYIGLNGKLGVKEKAKQLLEQINRAIEKGRIPDSDPYTVEIYEIKKNLKSFITHKLVKTLQIETASLNGLEGILGCACQSKLQKPKPTIMSSLDFADLKFDTIGLRGKWHHLIGDPSPNFKAMVSGKPKLGKSTLCIEFAGYLARNHGKVLYVAKEEGLDYTLQQKLNDKEVAHPNLDVASVLPDNLAPYDFIFLDSVTRLCLKPEDLARLEQSYPAKAFIYVFQTTKDGRFRGANSFQHNVDVVIEVPEKGKAVQMGRFNQGGEIDIFEDMSMAA